MSQEQGAHAPCWTQAPATRADLPAIHALYETVRGPGRSMDHLGWALFDAPFDPLPPMLALEGERCVGLHALRATPLLLNGVPVMGCRAAETVIHPGYEGQGLSETLARASYAAAEQRGFRLVYGRPGDAAEPLIITQLDAVDGGEVQRWVRPLAAPGLLPAALAAPLTALIRSHARGGHDARARITPVTAETRFVLPPPMPRTAKCSIDKSVAWFAWRYAAEPHGAYEQLVLGDADTPDALILFTQARKAGALPVLVVREWLAANAKLRLAAMKALVAQAAERGCGSVVLHTNDLQAGVLLRGALFFPRPGTPLGFVRLGSRETAGPSKPGDLVVLGGDLS
ncbi:hypothetical protein [Aquabacter cavernae]|uniref:hypothetical protein n=1 Tax=Aquabacter cavernae TaxID=2496029 RepID=UPI000F8F3828|nr:hypothetical protein [Aquabacter cavernae]